MRKILSILLAFLLVFSLVACSNSSDKDNNKDNDSGFVNPGNDEYDEEEPTAPDIDDLAWEIKDLSISVPEIEIETFKVAGVDETFEVGVSPYNFTGENVIKTLKNNKFVSSNYTVEDKASWSEHGFLSDYTLDSGEDAYGVHYNIGETVSATNENDRIFVSIGRDTYEFKNSDGIYISFNFDEIDDKTQANTLSVLKDFVGDDMANYVVYAKDPDGKERDEDLEHELQLYEEIKTGIFVYVLSRDIRLDAYNSNITYHINVYVDDYQLNWLMESNHDYTPRFDDEFKYKPNDIFKSLSSVDISNHEDILKDYYLIGSETTYESSSVDNIAINYYYNQFDDELDEEYSYSLSTDKIDKDSYFSNEHSRLHYTCYDVNGKLNDLYLDIEGEIEFDDNDMNENEVVEYSKDIIPKKIGYILPNIDLDLSTIKFGEEVEIVGEYKHELVDGKWEYKLVVDLTCEYEDEIRFSFEWRSSNN